MCRKCAIEQNWHQRFLAMRIRWDCPLLAGTVRNVRRIGAVLLVERRFAPAAQAVLDLLWTPVVAWRRVAF